MALWLVFCTPYRAVLVRPLARDIVLYSWTRHLNLHCLSSIHVFTFKQLPGNIGPLILRHAMRSSSTTSALSFPAVPRQVSLVLPRRLFPSEAQVNAVYLEDAVFFFIDGADVSRVTDVFGWLHIGVCILDFGVHSPNIF